MSYVICLSTCAYIVLSIFRIRYVAIIAFFYGRPLYHIRLYADRAVGGEQRSSFPFPNVDSEKTVVRLAKTAVDEIRPGDAVIRGPARYFL